MGECFSFPDKKQTQCVSHFCTRDCCWMTTLSSRVSHINVENNTQAQPPLHRHPQWAWLVVLSNIHTAYFMRGRRQRVLPPPPTTSGVGMGRRGLWRATATSLVRIPEQMAGRDVWRGRVHLTSRCQISLLRFEPYSYKRQCGIDGFIKVSLHSETFTAAAATWTNKGQRACRRDAGELEREIKIRKPLNGFPPIQ